MQRDPDRISADHDANVWSEYEIEARTSLVDRPLRTLKDGDLFVVLDSLGQIGAIPETAEGVYFQDTRFLSRLELRLQQERPLLLSSIQHADKSGLSIDLTNPDLVLLDGARLRRDTIFIDRTIIAWQGALYERICLKNFGDVNAYFRFDVLFDADFKDLFEVRGVHRSRRGELTSHIAAPGRVSFVYDGRDGKPRATELCFSPTPELLTDKMASFAVRLDPGEHKALLLTFACRTENTDEFENFFAAYRNARRARQAATKNIATVTSRNENFNDVVCRAASDIYTLVTQTPLGPYPYAGIPWFNTVFGRDGIITALLLLWMDPLLAFGVLRNLAATQSKYFDSAADAQPGKIIHEMRAGEMANLGEVPFRRYYGAVDATPLFLILAGAYHERTGDDRTIAQLWPNIEAAVAWMDNHGDLDGDGFVEYRRERESGLVNQGWKDSHDSIFHKDGANAKGPIALCEVQAYVFAAKRAVASLARRRGEERMAERLEHQAEELRIRFEASFWDDDLDSYVLALDGDKRPCAVRASNAGHTLFAGIASPDRARSVMNALMQPESFSGWGVRTIAQSEARFNPMSYHNGSVWPHDNALIAAGFARYGLKAEAAKILDAQFNAALHQDLRRLPELFCGFMRKPNRGPTNYPVACIPQAWASAALFGQLASCLGLELDHGKMEIRFRDPVLPDFLSEVCLRNISLGDTRLDVALHRYDSDVTASILSREGPARVLLSK